MDIAKNNVSAKSQVSKENYVRGTGSEGLKVLFIGNSITRHEPKPEIGWNNDWGMAASKEENDYVHVAVNLLEKKYGKVNYLLANCGEWELSYFNADILTNWKKARDFSADVVVIRIGENMYNARAEFDNHPIAPHFANMVEYFCSNSKAKVVMTDLFWRIDVLDNAIREVAKSKGYTLVSIGDLGDDSKNKAIGEYWHEGVALHPNDRGMRLIAERIVDKI